MTILPEAINTKERQFLKTIEELCNEIRRVVDTELDSRTHTKQVRELSQKAGIWSFHHPPDLGGRPQPCLVELVLLHESLGTRNWTRLPGLLGPSPGLLTNAEEPLRSNYLKPLLTEEKRAAFGFTEPDDADRPTHGTIEGQNLRINGQKSYVTGGATADFINTLVEIEGHGPSMVVIDRTAKGVEVQESFGSSDGSSHVYITFRDVFVPLAHVVGKPGRGLPTAMNQITNTRMVLAAQSCGLAHWVIDFVAKHIQAPHRSGTPLATREGVRLRFSDMRIKAYAMRSMVYRTARLGDRGENVINEVIACKIFTTEGIGEIVDASIQLVGGNALRTGHPLDDIQRLVRSWRLAEGASDVLRLNLARGYLELDKGRL